MYDFVKSIIQGFSLEKVNSFCKKSIICYVALTPGKKVVHILLSFVKVERTRRDKQGLTRSTRQRMNLCHLVK